jgi:hypothetical protein
MRTEFRQGQTKLDEDIGIKRGRVNVRTFTGILRSLLEIGQVAALISTCNNAQVLDILHIGALGNRFEGRLGIRVVGLRCAI